MDTIKTTAMTVFGLFSIFIYLFIIQLFMRKLTSKLKAGSEIKINASYALMFIIWFLPFIILNLTTVEIFENTIDLIQKTEKQNPQKEIWKIGIIFSGLAIFWSVLFYYISRGLVWLFFGKSKLRNEVENNNYSYLLINLGIITGLILILLPVFEMILRFFQPELKLLYY
ncbi:MAG: hypothetical protein H3C39_06825 [Flavobacteriia bacterium]|nr:hypothetical protein [Flavobacteriia bacterium]